VANQTRDQSAQPLTPLAWDTQHFGFPVAEICQPNLSDEGLRQALDLARRQGVVLVYWSTEAERKLPLGLLQAYNGTRVDEKATFVAELSRVRGQAEVEVGAARPCVTLYPRAEPTPRLLALGVAAGEHSRFARDSRVPRDRFEALYRIWLERSTRGELADAVLVATLSGADPEPAGLITFRQYGQEAHIGLLAVLAPARGQGLGGCLMKAAHHWMAARGVLRSRVVTQLANEPACRLYRRSGYCLHDVKHVYHFWPCTGMIQYGQ
jgi:dTDP-4-amino-4,6-dideoxy-D-galactose acyltransferase